MAKSSSRSFVKSADTKASVSNSRAELDRMLRRYGATTIATSENLEQRLLIVTFVVPDSTAKDAPKVPVRLQISAARVYDALYGQPTKWKYGENGQPGKWVHNPSGYLTPKLEQAERVAWRNLILWVDAALSAASVGLQTITEALFAHAIVGAGGERMIDVVNEFQGQLGAGVQRLLTSGADEA